MFDTPPSNLPLEQGGTPPKGMAPPPRKEVSPAPQVAAPAPVPPAPQEPGTSRPPSGGKEPEDIFSGMDEKETPSVSAPEQVKSDSGRGSLGKVIGVVILVFLLAAVIAGAVWYFFIREASIPMAPSPKETDVIIEEPPASPTVTPTPPTIPTPPAEVTTEEATGTEETTEAPSEVGESPAVPAPDTDRDGLTDPEEAAFGTSVVLADSDRDSYSDGSEVQNGYDPAIAGGTLAASSRFRMVDVGEAWRMHLPLGWSLGVDTARPGDYMIRTDSRNTIQVHLDQKPSSMPFEDWLAANEPTVQASSLVSFMTTAGHSGWKTDDGRTVYITTGTKIIRMAYMTGGSGSIDYPAIFDHIVRQIEETP